MFDKKNILAFIIVIALGCGALFLDKRLTAISKPELLKREVKIYEGTKYKIPLNTNANKEVIYESDAPQIVEVSSDGILQGKCVGKALVKVFYKGGKEAKLSVEVVLKEEEPLLSSFDEIELKEKEEKEIKLNKEGKFEYSSSNKNIVTVDDKGKIKGHYQGKALVYVTLDNETVVIKVKVVGKKTLVESIQMEDFEMKLGEERELDYEVLPKEADENIRVVVDEKVLSYENGKVKALMPGETTIKLVSKNDVFKIVKVKVE